MEQNSQQPRKFKYEYLISGTILGSILVSVILYFNPFDLNDLGLGVLILTFVFPFLAGILGFFGFNIIRFSIWISAGLAVIYLKFFANCEVESMTGFLCFAVGGPLILVPGMIAIVMTGIIASSLRVIFRRGKFTE
ncbi:MAG: hypothetical protein A2896_01745 [Candidatus Nealsonbacteria bacterium RIFCSPLOWO2_01_FULL_43_32]|uniref:Uncharacterized protein n=1 Tax=Candidatus Nealsonbacteria bacterium RIFCSPLOWO2_01_FULL_43_32 TaxID=1801672 RepID=A0A1G2EEW9_9BACT|nr:MAG: hypothetical protein A2896_01745 [Candidatus Nealsonbacteria bacterium RIFCSPLOWO2_01_FULL_43_32]